MRVQPRKVRILADEVRGKNAAQAAQLLRFHPSKGARYLRKILISAMANAQENNNMSIETLRVASIQVDEGPRLKRIQPRAMGRAFRIVKKTSHITVVVDEAPPVARIKPHGTKAKARPTLVAPKKAKKQEPVAEVVEAPVVEETTMETAVDTAATVETDAATEVAETVAETEVAAEETPAEAEKEGEN